MERSKMLEIGCSKERLIQIIIRLEDENKTLKRENEEMLESIKRINETLKLLASF